MVLSAVKWQFQWRWQWPLVVMTVATAAAVAVAAVVANSVGSANPGDEYLILVSVGRSNDYTREDGSYDERELSGFYGSINLRDWFGTTTTTTWR